MSKRLIFFLVVSFAGLFLSACDQFTALTEAADVSQIQNAAFYTSLQATVASIQIPVIIVGLVSLLAGWKLGRFGLAINGCLIGGLLLYSYLGDSGLVPDANFKLALSVVGAIVTGLLAYFLYNLTAIVLGGAIGMTLMNGAWLQVAENVPPQLLMFASTFISALVMFFVFRLFLVAFSAVIGAAILMLAVPFETLWVIPVAGAGIVIQSLIALWLKDDIFQNLRGDFGAALGQAFGEVLGPIGVLREYQKGNKEQKSAQKAPKAAPEPKAEKKAAPPKQAAPQPQQPYQAPYQAPANKPVQPQQPYQAPENKSVQPQAPYQAPPPVQPQQPYQAPQAYQPPAQNIPPTQVNPQAQAFRPENYQIVLSTGQTVPLLGAQVTVGRNADNTIVLNDGQVSGYHMIFSIQAEGVVVWDNNSTNGTLLNGIMLVGAARLTTADILQVGGTTLRLMRVDL